MIRKEVLAELSHVRYEWRVGDGRYATRIVPIEGDDDLDSRISALAVDLALEGYRVISITYLPPWPRNVGRFTAVVVAMALLVTIATVISSVIGPPYNGQAGPPYGPSAAPSPLEMILPTLIFLVPLAGVALFLFLTRRRPGPGRYGWLHGWISPLWQPQLLVLAEHGRSEF